MQLCEITDQSLAIYAKNLAQLVLCSLTVEMHLLLYDPKYLTIYKYT